MPLLALVSVKLFVNVCLDAVNRHEVMTGPKFLDRTDCMHSRDESCHQVLNGAN